MKSPILKVNDMKKNGKITAPDIHIGKLIKEVFDRADFISMKQFADELHCGTSNIYKIFAKHDISTEQLVRISRILRYNFFKHYSDAFKNNSGS